MTRLGNLVRLRVPQSTEIQGQLGNAVATCLSSAFSSGIWASSPMRVGHVADRHSARGAIAEFGENAQVLVASDEDAGGLLLGCVLGGRLDDNLIAAYSLAPYGAQPGDGLLAYIGIVPSAQGSRVVQRQDDAFEVLRERIGSRRSWDEGSLAGLLFTRWLQLSDIAPCPRVFVRTRKAIGPVLHLIEKNGFEYLGRFDLDFNGEQQDRLVFRRPSRRKTRAPETAADSSDKNNVLQGSKY